MEAEKVAQDRLPDDVRVSVVVATYDRPDELRECLRAFKGLPLRQEIYSFLKENGCSLGSSVSLETDFAIVGQGPNVWQEVERARKMGVSVIRESELFDFFGRTGTSPDAPPPGERFK